jgi:hypothetical protein
MLRVCLKRHRKAKAARERPENVLFDRTHHCTVDVSGSAFAMSDVGWSPRVFEVIQAAIMQAHVVNE